MLYIPNELVVGFKKIDESFTGKKGFITYRELGSKTNKLFNQSSFDGWVENPKETINIENKSRSGFIINKKMTHEHSYFGQINTILIYHPDGFEFEISLYNLMQILEHSDINAQEIKEECILGWYKNYPYLITTNCEEYKNAKSQNNTILEVTDMNKDLVPGRTYYSKKEKNLIYIGKEEVLKIDSFTNPFNVSSRTGHVFLKDKREYVVLAKCQAAYSTDIDPDFEKHLENYNFSKSLMKFSNNGAKMISTPLIVDTTELKETLHDRITKAFPYSLSYGAENFDRHMKYYHDKKVELSPSERDSLKQSFIDKVYLEQMHYLPAYITQALNENLHFTIWSEKLQKPINVSFDIPFGDSDKPKNIEVSFFFPIIHKNAFVTENESNDYWNDRIYNPKKPNYRHLSPTDTDTVLKEFNINNFLKEINALVAKCTNPNNTNKEIDGNLFFQPIVDFLSKLSIVGYQYADSDNFDSAFIYQSPLNLERDYIHQTFQNLNFQFNNLSSHEKICEKSTLNVLKTFKWNK